jgi:hypothetical protein
MLPGGTSMNRGIIVGTVFDPTGLPAAGAGVYVQHVSGIQSSFAIKKFDINADKHGRFQAPFLWRGADWADDLTIINIGIGAWTDVVDGNTTTTTAKIYRHMRGYIIRDAMQPLNVASNALAGLPDLLDFQVSIIQALKNYKDLVPFWKVTDVTSTEGWIIAAGGDLYLQ